MNIVKYALTALLAITFTLLASHFAFAQVDTLFSFGTVQSYDVNYNRNGAVLTPRKDRIYLGRNCDAYIPNVGKGKWGQANGGLSVEITAVDKQLRNNLKAPVRIGFPRQNIDIRGCDL